MAVVGGGIGLVWIALWPDLDRGRNPTTRPQVVLSGDESQLSGRVLDANSKGLATPVVSIEHQGGRVTAETDDDGDFSAAIDASRPIALTIDAPDHVGAVVGRLCPGERRRLSVSLSKASRNTAPPAPIALQE